MKPATVSSWRNQVQSSFTENSRRWDLKLSRRFVFVSDIDSPWITFLIGSQNVGVLSDLVGTAARPLIPTSNPTLCGRFHLVTLTTQATMISCTRKSLILTAGLFVVVFLVAEYANSRGNIFTMPHLPWIFVNETVICQNGPSIFRLHFCHSWLHSLICHWLLMSAESSRPIRDVYF